MTSTDLVKHHEDNIGQGMSLKHLAFSQLMLCSGHCSIFVTRIIFPCKLAFALS